MGCHKIVAAVGNPEVQKLHGFWERKEPIPWVRVFKVPEHAKFVHKNHIQAGLPCQTCHGRIEAMEQVTGGVTGQSLLNDMKNLALMPNEPNKLSMGWCVECHRAANGGQLASLTWMPKPLPKLSKDKFNAPLECITCHH
jgi:Class III cytochrome C family.